MMVVPVMPAPREARAGQAVEVVLAVRLTAERPVTAALVATVVAGALVAPAALGKPGPTVLKARVLTLRVMAEMGVPAGLEVLVALAVAAGGVAPLAAPPSVDRPVSQAPTESAVTAVTAAAVVRAGAAEMPARWAAVKVVVMAVTVLAAVAAEPAATGVLSAAAVVTAGTPALGERPAMAEAPLN